MSAVVQLDALQPVQEKQWTLDAAQFALNDDLTVLSWIVAVVWNIRDVVTVPCWVEVASRRISSNQLWFDLLRHEAFDLRKLLKSSLIKR